MLLDAQAVADRYIAQRAFPLPVFQSIIFPITNPEMDDSDRDNLLSIFMGQPLNIQTCQPRFQPENLRVMLRAGSGALALMNYS
jgi:hypothetical protein